MMSESMIEVEGTTSGLFEAIYRQQPRGYQHIETNVMHFIFRLLRIKVLYMFRALLAHPQEALHKRHLVYCVSVMSVGCTKIGVYHVPLGERLLRMSK
jgi:hypothetical protein